VQRLFASFRKRRVTPIGVVAQHSDGHFCMLLNSNYSERTATIVGNSIMDACTRAEMQLAHLN
jgi:hypothetical protein